MVKTSGKRTKMTKTYYLTENGLDIQVTKKAIRNMYLRVGGDGSVRVSAPLRMPERDIRRFILERMDWIEEKRQGTGQSQPPWELYKGGEREEKKQECRKRLEKILPQVIQECEQKTGVHAEEWRLRDMKTRWGNCNVQKKRIWLNVWLGEYPRECLEYVVTHELVHLLERGHNKIFYGYMDAFYPQWKNVKTRLNSGVQP